MSDGLHFKFTRTCCICIAVTAWMACAAENPAVKLYSLNPPVFKPGGQEFKFWRNETTFTKTYHVDCNAPNASDQNPGSASLPFKTINRAAEILLPGERVIVHAGIYRECIRPARGGLSPSQMIGYYTEGEVIVKGSVPAGSNWTREDTMADVYMLNLKNIDFGSYNPFELDNLPNASFDFMVWAQELRGKLPYTLPRGMVFMEGARLKCVATKEELSKTGGSHWTDRNAGKLFVHMPGKKDPNKLLMEITTLRGCFRPRVRGLGFVHVRGFVFEQVGNGFCLPQEGAISVCAGNHWLIEENTVRNINGVGIDIGNGCYGGALKPPEDGRENVGWTIVRRNQIFDTGICGICGIPAKNALIEENTLRNNTFHPAELTYECAGIKTHNNRDALIRRNIITDNSVNGIWMDYDNRDSRCTQNVMLNCKQGFFIEASVIDPVCLVDRNIVWGGQNGFYEHDCSKQIFANNFIGSADVGIMLRGKVTDRMVTDKTPTAGGGHIVANNAFYQCKEAVNETKKPEFPPNILSGNISEKDGLKAVLDAGNLKLTLILAQPLKEKVAKTRILQDFQDRPWPADVSSPGALPLLENKTIECRLDWWTTSSSTKVP